MKANEITTINEIGTFLNMDLGNMEYWESMENNNSVDNGEVNVEFVFIDKKENLNESTVKIVDVYEL